MAALYQTVSFATFAADCNLLCVCSSVRLCQSAENSWGCNKSSHRLPANVLSSTRNSFKPKGTLLMYNCCTDSNDILLCIQGFESVLKCQIFSFLILSLNTASCKRIMRKQGWYYSNLKTVVVTAPWFQFSFVLFLW